MTDSFEASLDSLHSRVESIAQEVRASPSPPDIAELQVQLRQLEERQADIEQTAAQTALKTVTAELAALERRLDTAISDPAQHEHVYAAVGSLLKKLRSELESRVDRKTAQVSVDASQARALSARLVERSLHELRGRSARLAGEGPHSVRDCIWDAKTAVDNQLKRFDGQCNRLLLSVPKKPNPKSVAGLIGAAIAQADGPVEKITTARRESHNEITRIHRDLDGLVEQLDALESTASAVRDAGEPIKSTISDELRQLVLTTRLGGEDFAPLSESTASQVLRDVKTARRMLDEARARTPLAISALGVSAAKHKCAIFEKWAKACSTTDGQLEYELRLDEANRDRMLRQAKHKDLRHQITAKIGAEK